MSRQWTPCEEIMLREMLKTGRTLAQVGRKLGRTEKAVESKCSRLKIGKKQQVSLKMIEINREFPHEY